MRKIKISNFKNIGINTPATIDIPDEGGLCVVLGENNAGKSNVLKAIATLGSRDFLKEDIPNYYVENDPTITYCSDTFLTNKNLIGKECEYKEVDNGKETKLKVVTPDEEKYGFANKKFAIVFNKKTIDTSTSYMKCSADEFVSGVNELVEKNENVFALCEKIEIKPGSFMDSISFYFMEVGKIYHCKLDNVRNSDILECYRVTGKEDYAQSGKHTFAKISSEFKFYLNATDARLDGVSNAEDIKEYLRNNVFNGEYVARDLKKEQEHKEGYEYSLTLTQNGVTWNSSVEGIDAHISKLKTYISEIKDRVEKAYVIVATGNNTAKGAINKNEVAVLSTGAGKSAALNLATKIPEVEELFENGNYASAIALLQSLAKSLTTLSLSKIEDLFTEEDIVKISQTPRLLPNIFFYDEADVKRSDLIVSPDEIEKSVFFKSFLDAVKIDPKQILKVYSQHREKNKRTSNILNSAEEMFAKILDEGFNQKFNELYYGKKGEPSYNFRLVLDEDKISLVLFKNKDELVIDEQSIGFRKFFSMFFKFLYQNVVKRGDIVLMDEAETHLSIPVQKELRSFLKTFGEERGITFIISTHSYHMLDIKHLDEIRIVKSCDKEHGATISNDFSLIPDSDADTLADIKRVLGIEALCLFDRKDRPIFVEGVTDYNYLTAMYHLYVKAKKPSETLLFLPICGLGSFNRDNFEYDKLKATPDQVSIKNKLFDIASAVKEDKVILLVDGDRAGAAMATLSEEDKKFVVETISDAIKNSAKTVKNIEDMFDESVSKRYDLVTKSRYESSRFKNDVMSGRFEPSEETKERFFALFNYIIAL